MTKHILLDILLFFILITCPWWVTVLFAIFVLFSLKSFHEIILLGLIMDIYFGSFSQPFRFWDYKFTLFFILLLLASFFIKKRLRLYLR